MKYLNKVQYSMLMVVVSLIITPQLMAQSTKSMFSKVNSLRTPVIQTDKPNYEPGETVDIAGVEFLSYERIRLNVRYIDENNSMEVPLGSWDVYADAKGRVATEWQVFDVGGAGSRFIIEAEATISGATSKTEISTDNLAGESVNLAQCANSNATPQNLTCPNAGPSGWVTGTAGSANSRYFEGNSIAYRNVLGGLNVGKTYKWTVKYDTSKGGLNAIDYLTTYNRTISSANPCANGANPTGYCTLASVTSTAPIPTDPKVTAGRDQIPANSDDITQIPGVITAWGVTISTVTMPSYAPAGFPAGDTTASVDITFVANSATAVIAWGGHISTRANWGQTFGSVNISGSPYHFENGGLMNITDGTSCCAGTQSLSLQAAAVAPSATINIIKHATPPSLFPFEFSATPGLTPSPFTLIDNSSSTDPVQSFTISTFNVKTITETVNGSYDLISIVCTITPGGGGTPTPIRTGDSIAIDIKSGDEVTCTFNNDFITAAAVSVSGRVFDSAGNGLPRANVSVTDAGGTLRSGVTNQFGYYTIYDMEAGDGYVFNVWHRSYTFTPQFMNVDESLNNLNFYPE